MTAPTASPSSAGYAVPPALAGRPGDLTAPAAQTTAVAFPWLAAAVAVASTSVLIGLIWDISWHMTIGRDTFWTPAHLAIYFGGIMGGAASGLVALRTTFRGSDAERSAAVRFWGFRAPLGAWVSIWGAFAMVASAPFDDWWHNAYGLDVEILSPPHTVLAAGIIALALGAMLVILAAQNRADAGASAGRWALAYAYVAGLLLSFPAIMTTEYSWRTMQHTSLFYRVACAVFPFFLVATGNTARHRWGATLVAGSYTLVRAGMLWILPLFPATPKLGPIYQDITHMVPMEFPLLLIAPAVAMDLVRQRLGDDRPWRLALAQGAAFFAVFWAAQWPFASFLITPAARNWFFNATNFPYDLPKTSGYYRGEWSNFDGATSSFAMGMTVALCFALISSAAGATWAQWLRKVKR